MKRTQNIKPPVWSLALLKAFIHQDYLEEIEGDLEELYLENIEVHSKSKADRIYIKEVLKLFRPILLKSLEGAYRMNSYGIFKNYLKVARRNILANKLGSVIKIAGLAIAMVTVMVIYQYIAFEKSYDLFHPNVENLYRVEVDRIHAGEVQSQKANSYSAFGPDAKADISGIKDFTRIRMRSSSIVVNQGDKRTTFTIEKPAFVDPSFLSFFDFGQSSPSLLEDPKSIVLTQNVAKNYFGDENPVGQTVLFIHGRYERPLKVAEVIPDVPRNSHIQFEALVPYQAMFPDTDWISHSWDWSGVTTYLQLTSDASISQVTESFSDLVIKYKGEKMKEREMNYDFSLRPISEIHLEGNLDGELEVNGSADSVYFLALAAMLILVISWLNNVNLSAAQNATRSKEMTVRRVLGAHKKQVFTQLFVESLFIHLAALVLSAAIVLSSKEPLESLLGFGINWQTLFDGQFVWLVLAYIILGSALVSLGYSSLVRHFQYKDDSTIQESKSSSFFRKFGVAFQFGISLTLIAVTCAVNSQLDFVQSFNLGLDKEHTIVIKKPRLSRADSQSQSSEAFQNNLRNLPFVQSFTSSFQLPGSKLGWSGGMRQTTQPKEMGVDLYATSVTDNYIKTLGLGLIAGKSFEQINNDELIHVILNRSAIDLLGFANPAEAIGKDLINSRDREQRIVGVIEDFHYSSLREHIEPMMISHLSRPLDYVFVKLDKGDTFDQLESVESSWNQAFPNASFEFFFLDDQINRQYQADLSFKQLFTVFSQIGILLALMGVFGLSSFYASRRTKEIGIRKVLGASQSSIVWLLTSSFLFLVIIGSAAAIPVSFYLIDSWLADFAYQVTIGWWWFAGSFGLVLVLAWAILSIQTFRTAQINPAECLKDE